MDLYDDMLRRAMELEQYLKPIREYERLFGLSTLHSYREELERGNILKSVLPDSSCYYLDTIKYIQPTLDQLRDYERHSSAMAHLTSANGSLSEYFTKHAEMEQISIAAVAINPHWHEHVLACQRYGDNERTAEMALRLHHNAIVEAGFIAQQRLNNIPLGPSVSKDI